MLGIDYVNYSLTLQTTSYHTMQTSVSKGKMKSLFSPNQISFSFLSRSHIEHRMLEQCDKICSNECHKFGYTLLEQNHAVLSFISEKAFLLPILGTLGNLVGSQFFRLIFCYKTSWDPFSHFD